MTKPATAHRDSRILKMLKRLDPKLVANMFGISKWAVYKIRQRDRRKEPRLNSSDRRK
jgi:hypothetical protein